MRRSDIGILSKNNICLFKREESEFHFPTGAIKKSGNPEKAGEMASIRLVVKAECFIKIVNASVCIVTMLGH